MCYYDLRIFENCLCKRWGDFRAACVQSTITQDICDRKFPSGREIRITGTCERCQEVDVITRELEKGERKLAQSLINGGHSALEELSTAVMGVYEELLNQRRRERLTKEEKEEILNSGDQNWRSPNVGESKAPSPTGLHARRSVTMPGIGTPSIQITGNKKRRRLSCDSPETPYLDVNIPYYLQLPRTEQSSESPVQQAHGFHEGDQPQSSPNLRYCSPPLRIQTLNLKPQSVDTVMSDIADDAGRVMHDVVDDLLRSSSMALPNDPNAPTSFQTGEMDPYIFFTDNLTSEPEPLSATDLTMNERYPNAQSDLHDLKIFKTYSRGFRNGLEIHEATPPPSAILEAPKPDDQLSEIQLSRRRFNQVNHSFLSAAAAAYKKLKRAAYSDKVSDSFRRFCSGLGELDDVLKTGFDALERFLDGDIPRSLRNMYCFLHVAYAMSQSESISTPRLQEPEFISGISLFKYCLLAESEGEDGPSEQDIFDEIVSVMWDELSHGLAWIKQENIGESPILSRPSELQGILRWSHERDAANAVVNTPSGRVFGSDGLQSLQPLIPGWKDLVTGTIFVHVVRFLKCKFHPSHRNWNTLQDC
ncbi:hypothetical protein ABW20_dc0110068 [Dactylellina cionopaga]|nr:hypothetical protein ABW20_dc0110068 [Dactylellina cionopaga]